MLMLRGRKKSAFQAFTVIIGIILLALIGQARQIPSRSNPQQTLRVAYAFDPQTLSLDPRNLTSSVERELADNIYGRLVRTDETGQLLSDLPQGFSVYGNRVAFSFKNRPRTALGEVLTSQDAAVSLKRLLLAGGGHHDLAMYLCGGRTLRSIDDECDGIEVRGNYLILETPSDAQLHLLIAALDSADYSVISSKEIDFPSGRLRSSALENSTGAFSISSLTEQGLEFTANKNYPMYSTLMPQKLKIRPMEAGAALNAYSRGRVDLLPPTTYWPMAAGTKAILDKSNLVYETIPIKVLYALFSERALRDFTVKQRLYFGLRIARAYQNQFPQIAGKPTSQYLQPLGVGGLNDQQMQEIESLRAETSSTALPRQMTFGVPQEQYVQLAKELVDVPQIKLVAFDSHPCNLEREHWPDVMMMGSDSAASETLALANYDFRLDLVPSMGPKSRFNLETSLTGEKSERIELLRRFHFEELKAAKIVPIEAAPFFAASRLGWKFHQTKLHSSMTFWTLRQD